MSPIAYPMAKLLDWMLATHDAHTLLSGYWYTRTSHAEPEIRTQKLICYDLACTLPISSFTLMVLPDAQPRINCFQVVDYLWVGFLSFVFFGRAERVWLFYVI
ncbi:hypothetical protein C8J57DRAFT_1522508 [Mycena rebaudengoi]|nr:hypothetical protein C8J57DRAFT_1522508 [Mycena rebaudengoi]